MNYGSIRYVNNLPVDHALVQGHVPSPAGLRVVEGTPAELNRALLAGRLDVSAVSAITLFGARDELVVLPEATIASHGPVDSVLLVSKVPFDELDGRDVAVTEDSATGALMLRILLERDVGVTPRYEAAPSDLDAMLKSADAALLIGDDALKASSNGLDAYEVLDLGEAWRAYTGLPMVYALWVARPDVAENQRDDLDALRRGLVASKRWAIDRFDAIVEEAGRRTGVPRDTLRTYYDRLTHALGPLERDGLVRFAREALELEDPAHPPARDMVPAILEAVP